jgi:hypothetical protein
MYSKKYMKVPPNYPQKMLNPKQLSNWFRGVILDHTKSMKQKTTGNDASGLAPMDPYHGFRHRVGWFNVGTKYDHFHWGKNNTCCRTCRRTPCLLLKSWSNPPCWTQHNAPANGQRRHLAIYQGGNGFSSRKNGQIWLKVRYNIWIYLVDEIWKCVLLQTNVVNQVSNHFC